jgi:hypothetical protein
MSNNSEMSICIVCKDSKEITNMHYCVCDAPVCSDCIQTLKIDDKNYKCPKCGEIQDIESTKLFRIH